MGNCFSQLKKNKVSPEVKKVAKSPAKSNDSRLSLFFGRENRKTGANKSELVVGEENCGGLTKSVSGKVTLETKSTTPWPRSDTSLEDILGSSSFLLDDDTKPKQADNVHDADQLIQELDQINCIRVNDHAVTNSNQETATYECNVSRPKTRRGPKTEPRGQAYPMNKVVSAQKENDSQHLKRKAGNKQQMSVAPANCARDKFKVAAQKCVRFVPDISSGDVLEEVDKKPVSPLVYDDKELGLIDQIEDEYGIR